MTIPKPVLTDSRICFGIAYFTSEEDAREYAKANPGSYNGGFFHGRATGRDKSWDYFDKKLNKWLYAVTE